MMDAGAIADAVHSGEQSARATAQTALDAIDAYHTVQDTVWIERLSSTAVLEIADRTDARVAAGEHLPLAGVPFAIKDNVDLAGLPTTAGCPAFAYTPARSAVVVERLLAAGAIPMGKTNLDQFATGLNGTRSPYGAPACVRNRAFVSGGSSSGSAVAVAAGLVAFALGTDTAGSGRVPAAINGLVGLKPTRGRWSSSGLVPACRSLDCISVFTNTIADAALIDRVVGGFDGEDAYSRPLEDLPRAGQRIGVPLPHQRVFLGDEASAHLYARSLDALAATGADIVPLDIGFLNEAAQLLYGGPWLAERTAALGPLLDSDPAAIDPVVREIVAAGQGIRAVELFHGEYRRKALERQATAMWESIDLLALPTAPCVYRIAEMRQEPIRLNSALGTYTNFVNLLDMSALALPAGCRSNGTGFGITLIGPAHADRALLAAGEAYLAAAALAAPPPLDLGDTMDTIKLCVVGAHLEGMPLHWQLTSRNATLVEKTHTAPTYRLYAMANSTPPKPALAHAEDGQEIEVEVYALDVAAFGSFVADVPPPLAIGTVTLASGEPVKGFVAEPRALAGAEDITALGGWRAYIARG
ncbi:allophanate hydrolase [Sphingomonas sp. PL-96]|uniref:allophanate hydrolase n=1 Tax=Sphingomonas sp. PL-96 TaxID=2887201 RepID=UPI001E52CF7C|nr:allophanate hydrolase [Sphingomonas sp. PL-96]MCC2978312.1 allophanate hydrolase [Sphingomonas sp. PL-96]